MRNILIAHNYYKIPGGEDTVVANEKKLLIDNGHRVITYFRNNSEIDEKGFFKRLLVPIETIFSIKTYKDVKEIIKSEKIDVIHVHNTFPLISPSIYYAAKVSNVPIVQTIHNYRLICPGATLSRNNEICEKCVEGSLINSIKHKCYRNSRVQTIIAASLLWIHRLLGTYSRIDKYIFLTKFGVEKFEKIIDESKIIIKQNFCFEEVTEKRNIGNYYLYIGRIEENKGVRFLLDTWRNCNSEELIFVGAGSCANELISVVENNEIPNVKYLGFKTPNELSNIILHSKAVIIPSIVYETFGMIAIESFAKGVPVIASKIGALANIVSDNENGFLFDRFNYKELVHIVNNKMKNEAVIKRLSEGAKRTYNERYTDNKNYEILMGIYETVIGSS